MGALIDSSVFIAAERGKLDLANWLDAHADETFALSVVTASELLHGVHRAPAGRRRAARLALVESILATYPVHAVDIDVARVHARVWATMAAKGTAIGAHDLWIAATALALGLSVVTLNQDDFDRVPGLAVRVPSP